MTDETKENLNGLITSINLESYDLLTDCYKTNLSRLRFDMGNTIKSIDPNKFWEASNILRELQTRVELILKLSDFIDYVGVLQGTIIEE